MSRAFKIAAAGVIGFAVPVAAILLTWGLAFDSGECSGDECALELAAVITGAIITGSFVGATCGFATYAFTGRPRGQD